MSEDYGQRMFNDREFKLARAKSAINDEMKSLQEDAYRMGQQSRAQYVSLVDLVRANIDNPKLTDKDFREFVGRLLEG